MVRFNFFIILLFGAAFMATGVGPGRQNPYPVVTTVKDDVKIITNPDYPLDGRFTGKLTEEMSCGEEATPESAMLNRPFDLRIDDQGRIYVMDAGDVHFKVYDERGIFLRAIGRKGQGPGELGGLVLFELTTDGKICALDDLQRRVTILSTDGQYLYSFPLQGSHRGLDVDGQSRLYLGKFSPVEEPKLSTEFREVPCVTSIFRADASGKEMVHMADILGESLVEKAMSGDSGMTLGGPYSVIWAVSRRGKLYGGCNETFRLNAYGTDGKLEFTFGREFTPLKNPRYTGRVGQKKTMPAFERAIVFDEKENLWLELSKEEKTKGFTYDVFSPEGIYLKQVKIDQRIFQFKNRKVYSIVRPADGYPSVKRFQLELVPQK